MSQTIRRLVLLCCLVSFPSLAFAQATLTGVVKDPSGASLPGVTVVASSPALIEKTRVAVTDGTGQYRIEDLRPGTYALTFTLQGFSVVKREGVELTGSFTATVDADLRVGQVAETVVVSGETPVVDVQSAKRQMTIDNEVIRSIPNTRNYNSMVVLVPGVTTNVNDIGTGIVTTQFPIHGGRANEGRMTVDGLNVGNPPGGGQPPTYVADIGNAEEVAFTSSGGLGESETAGLVMNIVPKAGGNSVHGAGYFSGTGKNLQADNGLGSPLTDVYDINGSVGGPILRDRLWYFINGRKQASTRTIPGVFYNNNAGDPNAWLYAPDPTRPEYTDRIWENLSGRVTWQATPRNKIGVFWDEQVVCRTCEGTTIGITDPRLAPEAGGLSQYKPLRVKQATWSSPMTTRLLLDAGLGTTYYGWGNFERDPNPTRNLVRVTESCASGCGNNGGVAGITYRSQDFADNYTGAYTWRASASYITGAHSMKAGYLGTFFKDDRTWFTNDQNLAYQFNNGVPNRLTQLISPWVNNTRASWDAIYAQEQWTHRRLTLQGAVRLDVARSWFPEQRIGPSRFLPTAIVFPETKGVDSYKDISPRIGAAYDVFGDGRTAIKLNVGKYLEGVGTAGIYANANPTLRMPSTLGPFNTQGITRSWTDSNNNFSPDCDLSNPAAQNLTATGGDVCGVMSNTLFGQNVLTNNFDPALLNGWGVRPSDWNVGVTLQQQIFTRASIEVAYSRRSFRGFTVNDNVRVQTSDYQEYSLTAPSDSRLPNGGGYPINGLLDVNPALAGQVSNFVTDAENFGDTSQVFNGLDVTVNMRMRNGLTVQGGTSTGQTVTDACAVRANLPELNAAIGPGLAGSTVNTTNPYCHVSYGVLTQLRGLVSYTIPKVDVQVSGVMQSKPGALLAANYAYPAAQVAAVLGRPVAGNPANVTVNLLEPGTSYGDRVNQLDFRAAKVLRFGARRATIGTDIYNVLNSDAVLSYNNTFVPNGTWLQPISVLTGRMARISAEFTF